MIVSGISTLGRGSSLWDRCAPVVGPYTMEVREHPQIGPFTGNATLAPWRRMVA